MSDPVTNFAKCVVSGTYSSADTAITLQAGEGAKLPQPSTAGEFNLVWWNYTDYPDPSGDPNREIVRCTARTTDALTVTRGQESISATSKNTASKTYMMALSFTKKPYDDILALLATALTASGGTLTGELNLGENAGLVLDTALSADGKYSGIVEDGTAGATLAFGDVCYFQASDSRWELADANLSAGYDKKLGICVLASASDGTATKMLLIGKIRADAKFPTMTIGSPVYMSETAGAVVVAQPTTADACIRVLGYANTADELYFNPSPDYITHT